MSEDRPIPMDQLMKLLEEFEKAAKDSRDGQPGSVNQDTWHFFNGKLSAIHDVQARLELYTKTWRDFKTAAQSASTESNKDMQSLRVVVDVRITDDTNREDTIARVQDAIRQITNRERDDEGILLIDSVRQG